MEELRVEDPQFFFNYLRMEPDMFDELVQRVEPRVEKHDTKMPFGFSANEIRMCGLWNAVGML